MVYLINEGFLIWAIKFGLLNFTLLVISILTYFDTDRRFFLGSTELRQIRLGVSLAIPQPIWKNDDRHVLFLHLIRDTFKSLTSFHNGLLSGFKC